jgi:hypothetical protein
MRYYCLHHTPAFTRKAKMDRIIEEQDITDIEWIEDFLPDSDIVSQNPIVYSEHAANGEFLNDGEISIFLKHKLAFSKILDSNDYGLVLEDDIDYPNFLFKNTIPIFIDIMKNKKIEFLSIGSCCGLNYDLPSLGIISNRSTKTRCAHCYLTHSQTIQKINSFFSSIICPIDWQINLAIEKFDIISGWSFPYVLQDTQQKSLLR